MRNCPVFCFTFSLAVQTTFLLLKKVGLIFFINNYTALCKKSCEMSQYISLATVNVGMQVHYGVVGIKLSKN